MMLSRRRRQVSIVAIIHTNAELENAKRLYPTSNIIAVAGHSGAEGLCEALRFHGLKTAKHILSHNDTDFRYAIGIEGKATKATVAEAEAFAVGFLWAKR